MRDIWDEISGGWIKPQNAEIGHRTDYEFWYLRNQAEAKGMTQAQFNDFMNNSKFYAWQDVHNNRSHLYENRHK